MSSCVLVLDFWTRVSDYLRRSTLSSLRARSVPAPYPACTERSLLKRLRRHRCAPAPREIEVMHYMMSWHPRLDEDSGQRWLREIVRSTAAIVAGG